MDAIKSAPNSHKIRTNKTNKSHHWLKSVKSKIMNSSTVFPNILLQVYHYIILKSFQKTFLSYTGAILIRYCRIISIIPSVDIWCDVGC